MASDQFWREIEDAGTESGGLGDLVRRLGGIREEGSPVDWAGPRERTGNILEKVRLHCGQSSEIERRLTGLRFKRGGAEHDLVRLADEPGRIFKMTHSDSFGIVSELFREDPEFSGRHFHAGVNPDPVLYLQRWMLLNSLSEYQTRYEGMLPPAANCHIPRICVSQPFVGGPDANPLLIQDGFATLEFFQVSQDTFLRAPDRILLSDAAPRNVKVADQVLVPFDVVAQIATEEVIDWATQHLSAETPWRS